MDDQDIKNKLTVIFLLDSEKPSKVVMLKRGADRKFAPDMYTGLGGKIRIGELILDSAIRELGEEAPNFGNIALLQFGKLIVNKNELFLNYFWGIASSETVPECTEGTLEWVDFTDLFGKDIIPTTKFFLREWQKRGWDTTDLFTVFLQREDVDNIHSKTKNIETKEGLLD